MFEKIGEFVSDIGSAFGGPLSTALDVWKMGRASDESEFNRDWQAEMRRTQYQTAVADMRKAGINPMLAFSQGGAGNLTGAVGQVGDVSNPVTSAYEIKALRSAAEKMANDAENAWWTSKRSRAEAYTSSLLFDVMNNNKDNLIEKMAAESSSAKSLAEISSYQIPSAKSEADMWRRIGESGKEIGPVLNYLMQFLKMFKPAGGGVIINK